MKRYLAKLIGVAGTGALILLLPACATQTSNAVASDDPMERALVASGFRVRQASSTSQRQHITAMSDKEFELVRQNGNEYYVYASKRSNRIYVGDKWAYRAYQGYVRNNELRKQGVFVWEVHPGDRANNRTVDVYEGYPPFGQW